jgi:hypothetical protein
LRKIPREATRFDERKKIRKCCRQLRKQIIRMPKCDRQTLKSFSDFMPAVPARSKYRTERRVALLYARERR